MNFDFATANRIIFKVGGISLLPEIVSQYGSRCLFVTGQSISQKVNIYDKFREMGFQIQHFIVRNEPDINLIQEGVRIAKEADCDFVVGMGGGSTIDAGKAIAILAKNPGSAINYLEVVGNGEKLRNLPLPFFAVPTTAGTGSEVTRNAVISVPDQHVKVSLRSEMMLPKVALIDPALTLSLPPALTASTGMDAICQVLEPYVSKKANLLVDIFCREGICRGGKFLNRAYLSGDDIEARTNMSWVSLLGGLSLANAGLGAVHGFAGPIGGMCNAPHGAICARLLPFVVEANIDYLSIHEPDNPALRRYQDIAGWITGKSDTALDGLVDWLKELIEKLAIPRLSTYSINSNDIPLIVEKSEKSSSMKGNPIELPREELSRILENAL